MWLRDILTRRQVHSVAWFHTDHWEPWAAGATDDACRQVDAFIAQSANSRFARKSSLFYLPGLDYHPSTDDVPARGVSVPGDIVEFRPRGALADRRVSEGVGNVRASLPVDFQFHLHHEHLTYNGRDWNAVHKLIREHTDAERDEQRFRLVLQLSLEAARRDTGLPFDRWAFIHGNWGLNGSDPDVCHIFNEIMILAENGCWGDFTFPAGNPHCDPRRLERPYSFTPFVGTRCYDSDSGGALPIDAGTGTLGPGRFLVWNARAKHDVSSLDIGTAVHRERLRNRNRIVSAWLRDSPVLDNVLYVKTYAHSMDACYYEDGAKIPFADRDVVAIFDLLEAVCDGAGIELRACTVNEVYAALRALDTGEPMQTQADGAARRRRGAELQRVSGDGVRSPGLAVDVHALNERATAFLAGWIGADDNRKRAAAEYYLAKFACGQPLFESYDVVTADYASAVLRKTTKCVDLGSGFGELPILLTLAGFSVVGFEAADGRHEGAVALSRALRQQGLGLDGLLLINGFYPSGLPLSLFGSGAETALFCTHTNSDAFMAQITDIFRSMRLFDHLLINLPRFGTVRDPVSAAALFDQIGELGFAQAAEVYGSEGTDIRHFTRKS